MGGEKSIKLSEFIDYHAWVTSVFKELFEGMAVLNPEAGLELETKLKSMYAKAPEDLTRIPVPESPAELDAENGGEGSGGPKKRL